MSRQEEETLHLDQTVAQSDIEVALIPVVKTVRPEWEPAAIKYHHFTHGISNKLVGAYTGVTMDDDPNAILIRIYGNNTDLLVDREAEKSTFKLLFRHNCGARLHLTFNNGCCYGYIAGRVLDVENVRQPDIYTLVIRRMVQMHCIRVDDPALGGSPSLFETLEKWLGVISTEMKTPQQTQR